MGSARRRPQSVPRPHRSGLRCTTNCSSSARPNGSSAVSSSASNAAAEPGRTSRPLPHLHGLTLVRRFVFLDRSSVRLEDAAVPRAKIIVCQALTGIQPGSSGERPLLSRPAGILYCRPFRSSSPTTGLEGSRAPLRSWWSWPCCCASAIMNMSVRATWAEMEDGVLWDGHGVGSGGEGRRSGLSGERAGHPCGRSAARDRQQAGGLSFGRSWRRCTRPSRAAC